jgi:hypothetical protein
MGFTKEDFLIRYRDTDVNEYNTILLHLMILKNYEHKSLLYLVKAIINLYSTNDRSGLATIKIFCDVLIELDIIVKTYNGIIVSDCIDDLEVKDIIYMCKNNISVKVYMRKKKIQKFREIV